MTKNPEERLKKAIYISISTKGGVGKTTTSTQVLAPYLYETINRGKKEGFQKVKVFEIDAENNSQRALKNTVIMDSELITDADLGLQDVLIDEISNMGRDYPIVIDIGVAYTRKAFKTLSSVLGDEDVVFLVPTKQAEQDANNTSGTITEIQKLFPKKPIVLVLSDSQWEIGIDAKTIEQEYGILFGKWYDANGSIAKSIFQKKNLPQLFFSVPKDTVINEAAFSENRTVYELAMEKVSMEKQSAEKLVQLEKKYAAAQKANDQKQMESINLENKIRNLRVALANRCYQYYQKNLKVIFSNIDKIMFSSVFKA